MTARMLHIHIDDAPRAADVQIVRQGLIAFNVCHGGIDRGQELAVFLRDETGQIWGGAIGWIWGAVLEIEYVWVHEELRGQGHGYSLLSRLEQEAMTRDCAVAVLDTYSFQAPQYYQKCGYKVFGVVEGYPRSIQKYFLHKQLGEEHDPRRKKGNGSGCR